MINWPAIIKHSDDAELTYINSLQDWLADTDLHTFEYDETDYIVDSTGNVFNLINRESIRIKPLSTGHSLTLDVILGLVKAHAAQKGSCCVAKLYAPSIRDAFKIIKSLDEL